MGGFWYSPFMKVIYFVRHGESEGNAGATYQLEDSSLSEKGREQAAQVADRVSRLLVHALVSSPLPRTKETAEIISKKIGLPVTYSELFVERRRPSKQRGLDRMSPEAIAIDREFIRSAAEAGYRYADEENFDDLAVRSHDALEYLAAHPADQLLVVTHGMFLRVLVARAIFGEQLTGPECSAFIGALTTANTGLTVLTYDPDRERPWLIATWNDHAHLG